MGEGDPILNLQLRLPWQPVACWDAVFKAAGGPSQALRETDMEEDSQGSLFVSGTGARAFGSTGIADKDAGSSRDSGMDVRVSSLPGAADKDTGPTEGHRQVLGQPSWAGNLWVEWAGSLRKPG